MAEITDQSDATAIINIAFTKLEGRRAWIEQACLKRECNRFIASQKDRNRCCCGRYANKHDNLLAVPLSNSAKWNPLHYTTLTPTDAYGTINFQGSPHPNKAQYVRLSFDTSPEVVLRLLQVHWGLELPKLVISIHGGIANFDLPPKLKRVFRKGLLKAAKTAGAWIITAGTNTGVMRLVGDALGDSLAQSRNNIVTIGIAPWGVIRNRADLIGKDIEAPYYSLPYSSGGVSLNCNHSYFLLADNGTVGKYGCEIVLRKRLEKFISMQKITTCSGSKSYSTPVVCMVLEGGVNTVHTVFDYVTDEPPVPVVVVNDSGRAANLLSLAHKVIDSDRMDEVEPGLLLSIRELFRCSLQVAKKVFLELVLLMKKKSLINIFQSSEGSQDLDLTMLTALFQVHNKEPSDQLSLALAWNRADIARSHIFVQASDWQANTLDQAMMDALINDSVAFVELLLQKGVSIQRWLTIGRLEELYNAGLRESKSRMSVSGSVRHVDDKLTLRHLIKEKRKNKQGGHKKGFAFSCTLFDIGQVLDSLMGGAYRSTYSRKKFQKIYREQRDHSGQFRYPYHELMVWAVLLRRQQMAKFMWRHGEEALAKALVACKLYKSMAREAEQDDFEIEVSEELVIFSQEFADLAFGVLDHCYRTDDDMTLQLLTYRLKSWSDETCLSLAYATSLKEFIAHPCCQMLLTQMWMGALRSRKYTQLRILGCLVMPLTVVMLEFKTPEELRLLPQTAEEHLQAVEEEEGEAVGEDVSDSSSSSDSSDDEDAVLRATSDVRSLDATRDVSRKKKKDKTASVESLAGSRSALNRQSVLNAAKARMPPLRKQLSLGKKFYEFYTAPITKFWAHAISYVVFLVFLTYITLVGRRETADWPEWCVIVYVCCLAIDKSREIVESEPKKFVSKFKVYFSDIWNILDVIGIILFIIGVVIRYCIHPDYGHVLYTVSVICFYSHVFDMYGVSKFLGTYITMVGKMIVDLIKFIVFMIMMLLSYGVLRQSITYPFEQPNWNLAKDVFLKPYFNIYGEMYSEEIGPPCNDSSYDIWVPCVPGTWLVPVGLTIFMICCAILLVNLLIAKFSNTFFQMNENSTQVWMFGRYALIMEHESKPMLPTPLSIFCHMYDIIKRLARKCRKEAHHYTGLKLYLSDVEIEKLHDFEEECVEDYFQKKQLAVHMMPEERLRVTNERVDTLTTRIDDITQRDDSLRLVLQRIDMRLADLEDWVSVQTPKTLPTSTATGEPQARATRILTPVGSKSDTSATASASAVHLSVSSQLFRRRRKRHDSGHSLKTSASGRGQISPNINPAKSRSLENFVLSRNAQLNKENLDSINRDYASQSRDDMLGGNIANYERLNGALSESPEIEVVQLLKPDVIPEEICSRSVETSDESGNTHFAQESNLIMSDSGLHYIPALSIEVPLSPRVHFPFADNALVQYETRSEMSPRRRTSYTPGIPLHRDQLLLQTVNREFQRKLSEQEEELERAEAGQCAEMEARLGRRLRQMSLTESPSMAEMATLAAQSLGTNFENEEDRKSDNNSTSDLKNNEENVFDEENTPLKRVESDNLSDDQ